MRTSVDAHPMHEPKEKALDEQQLESFLEQHMFLPNSYTTEKQNHLLMIVKNLSQSGRCIGHFQYTLQ